MFWTELLGFPPRDLALYDLAMCHKSAVEAGNGVRHTNERLEFLGDAVLSAVCAEILLQHFPDRQEGFLTRTRAKIVCRASLNELAKQLGIDKRIKTAGHVKQNMENLYGNAFEALIGAIYLDYDHAHCKQFVERLIRQKHINLKKAATAEVDFKSRLLEWGQKEQKQIQFEQISETLAEDTNVHTFLYKVKVNGETIAEAKGTTKREAQQTAASFALRKLRKQQQINQKHTKTPIV